MANACSRQPDGPSRLDPVAVDNLERRAPSMCLGAPTRRSDPAGRPPGVPMDFELTPEQEEFRKIVRAFAEEVVAPRAEAMDRAEELDPEVLDQMAGMGLFGLPFPEEVG